MFDWPMSSPQMMQMFGFLPSFWSVADTFCVVRAMAASVAALSVPTQHSLPTSGQVGQKPISPAGAVAGDAFKRESSRPDAAAHPPANPTASANSTGILTFRIMMSLLGGEGEGIRQLMLRIACFKPW